MEENQPQNNTEETQKPVVNEWDKPLAERYGLSQEEVKSISDSFNGNLAEASTLQLELLVNSNHSLAKEALYEMQRRNTVAAIEKQKAELEGIRGKKKEAEAKEADLTELKEKVRREPAAVTDNFAQLLKAKGVKMPPLFTETASSKIIEGMLKKSRPQKGK